MLDITQRKLVELALRESELRMRLLHELSEAARALVDPEQFMPLALRLLGEHLPATRCSFAILEDISLSLHTSSAPLTIFADPGQIEQVVMNLVINARDAMPAGGSVTLETSRLERMNTNDQPGEPAYGLAAGSYAVLTVADTGGGMSAATRARIFEPFFTTKDKTKGTGLGLSTVHGIVAQSGAQIRVHSELERGTTFTVYFPRADHTCEQAPEHAPQPLTLRGSETVLVVDDEDQVRTIACTVLRRNGYQVLEAHNAGEAFLICEQQPERIHLLLTDVVMPRVGGRELAERMATLRPDTRILYMSGYAEDSIARHGAIDPGLAFLQNPITPRALLVKVREVLDR